MTNITDFGREVKKRLIDLGKTQAWLIGEVAAKTGLYFDDSYLYRIMTGSNRNPKVIGAIQDILDAEEQNDSAAD